MYKSEIMLKHKSYVILLLLVQMGTIFQLIQAQVEAQEYQSQCVIGGHSNLIIESKQPFNLHP